MVDDIPWGTAQLDVEEIKNIKKRLESLLVKNQEAINSFYTYAKGIGRLNEVDNIPVLDAMERYEEYHDDLMTFVRALITEDTESVNGVDIGERIKMAAEVDNKFRKDLFKPMQKMVFSDALLNLDTVMYLYAFIDKIYDEFIELKAKHKDASQRVCALIDLLATSVKEFLRDIFTALTTNIHAMAAKVSPQEVPAFGVKAKVQYQLV